MEVGRVYERRGCLEGLILTGKHSIEVFGFIQIQSVVDWIDVGLIGRFWASI